jgi:hypothetical protein
MLSRLRKSLNEDAGMGDFEFIIPHPFLPPRFRKLKENQNLILLMDQDLTIHVRWEGSRHHEHHPLTPRAAQRLIQECLTYMKEYRRDVQVFSRFIGEMGEQPFDDPRPLDPARFQKPQEATAPKEQSQKIFSEVEMSVEIDRSELGGENPLPMTEEFYEL